MIIAEDNSNEKPAKLWNHVYKLIHVSDNKYNISNLVYKYLKFFSLSLLKKMKIHSDTYKLDMKEIIQCVT